MGSLSVRMILGLPWARMTSLMRAIAKGTESISFSILISNLPLQIQSQLPRSFHAYLSCIHEHHDLPGFGAFAFFHEDVADDALFGGLDDLEVALRDELATLSNCESVPCIASCLV
jgi:hypothetical protein